MRYTFTQATTLDQVKIVLDELYEKIAPIYMALKLSGQEGWYFHISVDSYEAGDSDESNFELTTWEDFRTEFIEQFTDYQEKVLTSNYLMKSWYKRDVTIIANLVVDLCYASLR